MFVELSSAQVRVLAHPLRLRLLGALRTRGPATSTTLAVALATNSGKTSYHLRQLAGVGLVVEDVERGNDRDRWWRAAHDVSSWSPTGFADDPDAQAAADWLLGHVARHYAAQVEHWLTGRSEWSSDWLAAADMSDLRLRLRPERLRQLNDDLMATIERYLLDQNPADDPHAVECTIIINGFPNPDPPP